MEPGMNGQGVINVHWIFFYSYVSKLHPEFTAFFQLPLEKSSGRQTWFVKRPFGKIIWPRKWAKFKKKLTYSRYTPSTVLGHLPWLSWISVEFRRTTFALCLGIGLQTAFYLTPTAQPTINGTRWVPSPIVNHMMKSRKVTLLVTSSSQLHMKAPLAAVTLYQHAARHATWCQLIPSIRLSQNHVMLRLTINTVKFLI